MPDSLDLAPLSRLAAADGLDAIALVPGSNFRKAFGIDFHANERPLVVLVTADGRSGAIVPELEMSRFVTIGVQGETVTWRDQTGYRPAFEAIAAALGPLPRIGVEGQAMRVFVADALQAAFPGTTLIDRHRAISRLRLCKTADEIARLERAIAISERALESTLSAVRVGMTETEIESLLLRHLFAEGADGLAFLPIVAAGANAANAHAKARPDYPVAVGDALLIDFGASHQGMLADITRTVFVAEASDRHRDIYAAVLAANAAGRAATRAGATAHDVDDAVQRVLEASPYADMVLTKTGHGLGLDVHEDPYIMRGNQTVLEPGMVFTIEPSLMRVGEVGIRIEDDVVVTGTGCRSLTSFPRELRLVG